MDAITENNFWTRRGGLLRSLHEIFLSLNIACALGYAILLYIARSVTPWTPQNDSAYYFLRGAVRVSDLLHHAAATPVTADPLARRDSILWRFGTVGLTVFLSIWSTAAVIYLLIRLFRSQSGANTVLRRISGPIALFLTPASCVVAWFITAEWKVDFSTISEPFGDRVLPSILCGELVGFIALSWMGRKRELFKWAPPVLVVHFAFWGYLLFPNFIFYIGEAKARLLIHITTWLIPSAGAAFLIYVRPRDRANVAGARSVGKWPSVVAAIGILLLVTIWLPSRTHNTIRASAGEPTLIKLGRGPCFGSCPVYTVTIRSDGIVEFDGKQSVKVKGGQTGGITDAQFTQIIGILNRVDFADLDDRAFSWCYDTPTVSIAVSASGLRKQVASDYGCSGSQNGVQYQFVSAADEIEAIVKTDAWVKCNDHFCR